MKILVNRKINRLFLCLLLIMAVFTATAIIFITLDLENTVLYVSVAAVLMILFVLIALYLENKAKL